MRYAVERQRAERRLARLALRDALTELPNRVLFADRLEQALSRAERRGDARNQVVLMFLDLDGFKQVNDGLGHAAGDEVLVEVARRLREQLRGVDTVARLGGDEFVVLCEGVADERAALALAERLGRAIAEPYEVAGTTASVSAAIGVALARLGIEGSEELLRRADAAMYEAKRDGAGRTALAAVA
jgi:diguanylate cyclase (GGDEF)-like protein